MLLASKIRLTGRNRKAGFWGISNSFAMFRSTARVGVMGPGLSKAKTPITAIMVKMH